jgi:hypothetical protein
VVSGLPPDPDDHAIARGSLEEGDFAHALAHVGRGLGEAPAAGEERLLRVLDELLEACPHPQPAEATVALIRKLRPA